MRIRVKTQEHRGLKTVSEAEMLPRKAPGTRPGRGIVKVGWGATSFIHAAGNKWRVEGSGVQGCTPRFEVD